MSHIELGPLDVSPINSISHIDAFMRTQLERCSGTDLGAMSGSFAGQTPGIAQCWRSGVAVCFPAVRKRWMAVAVFAVLAPSENVYGRHK